MRPVSNFLIMQLSNSRQLFRAGLLLMDGTFDIRHGQNNQTMI